jgi:hypothetical protein
LNGCGILEAELVNGCLDRWIKSEVRKGGHVCPRVTNSPRL